jgi:autotransporter-associated beta strand protein
MKKRPSKSVFPPANRRSHYLHTSAAIAGLLTTLGAISSATAATQTWDGSVSGVWDTSALNWDSGTAAWTSSNDALFSGTPTNNVTTATGLTIGSITLDNTFTGSVTMTGGNTVTGATTINGGTLNLNSNTGLGGSAVSIGASGAVNVTLGSDGNVGNVFTGSGALTVSGSTGSATFSNASGLNGFTGTLNVNTSGGKKVAITTVGEKIGSGATVNIASGGTLYISNTTSSFDGVTFNVVGSGNTENLGAIRIENNSVIGSSSSVVLGGNTSIGSNVGTGTINAAISESAASGLTKVGAQTLLLTGANTYTGGTTISAGTLQFSKLVAMPSAGAVTPNGGTLAVNVGGVGEWTTGTSGNGTIGGLLSGLGGQSGSTVSWSGNSALGIDTTNAGSAQTYSANIANVGTSLGIAKLGTGTLELSGANTYTGTTTVNAGTLKYTGTGTNFGQLTVNGNGANSEVNFASGAGAYTYTNKNFLVGNNATGAGVVNQSAGTITGVNQLQLGVVTGGSYGAYNLSGGSIDIQELDLGGFNGAPNGVMNISGGTLNDSNWLIVSRANGGTGLLNMTGGTVNFTGTTGGRFIMNFNANGGESAIINVANANFTATNATGGVLDMMRSGAAGQKGIINLLSGGVMQVQGIKASNTTGTSNFNFNGGTLKASTANASFITGLSKATVYSGGGTIDNNGVNVTVGQALEAPTGSGANSNPTVTSGGSGYIGAPIVTVTGAGGSGATAYATVSGGVVTGIVVTSPGTGYTGALSFTLTGGGGTGATIGTVTQTANTSGGMTFSGSGTTTLGAANTYTGSTTINAGTLALGASGSISNSASIAIKAGATFNTAAQSFTMLSAQPFTFTLDPTAGGSAGLLAAGALDISSGAVDFSTLGTLDDASYVIATYSSLTGSSFGGGISNLPSGYTVDYNFGGTNNTIALVAVPEPHEFALAIVALLGVMVFIRRRNQQA